MEAASLVAGFTGFPYAEPTGLVSWSYFLLEALFSFWRFLVFWLVFFLLLVGFFPRCLWSQGLVGSSWCCGGGFFFDTSSLRGLCGCCRRGWGEALLAALLRALQFEVSSVWVGWVKG